MTPPAPWIVNASPFIGLAKIEKTALLRAPGRELMLPAVVHAEIAAGPATDLAVQAAKQLTALGIRPLPPIVADPRVTVFGLDAGEEAVLSEALARPGSAVVIDDGAGRKAAAALGVPCTGTLGVLILARRDRRIPALVPLLKDLQAAGIFLPGDLFLQQIVQEFGETWP